MTMVGLDWCRHSKPLIVLSFLRLLAATNTVFFNATISNQGLVLLHYPSFIHQSPLYQLIHSFSISGQLPGRDRCGRDKLRVENKRKNEKNIKSHVVHVLGSIVISLRPEE
jgi:hypothetical protein